jgi:hypothetical protein
MGKRFCPSRGRLQKRVAACPSRGRLQKRVAACPSWWRWYKYVHLVVSREFGSTTNNS